jgi:hypothetical protein
MKQFKNCKCGTQPEIQVYTGSQSLGPNRNLYVLQCTNCKKSTNEHSLLLNAILEWAEINK